MIAALISSAFQVQYPVEGQMVIIDPPVLWIIVWWYAVALLGLLTLVGSLSTKNRAVTIVSLLLLAGGCFLGWKSSTPSSVTIDRRQGIVVFHTSLLGGEYVRPLSELQYALVETDSAAYRLVLVMEGGRRVGIGSYSDQGGQPEAAEAINKFIGVSSKPAQM